MFTTLLLSLLTILPIDKDHTEYASMAEINSFYDDKGKLVFDQIIFRDQHYHVRDWFLLPNRPVDKTPEQIKEWEGKEGLPYIPPYVGWTTLTFRKVDNKTLIWFTEKGGDTYRVIVETVVRTHSQHDPELLDREFVPKENRSKLRVFFKDLSPPIPPIAQQ